MTVNCFIARVSPDTFVEHAYITRLDTDALTAAHAIRSGRASSRPLPDTAQDVDAAVDTVI